MSTDVGEQFSQLKDGYAAGRGAARIVPDEWVLVPQPCHIMRSTTVNDGSPQSRCALHLGYRHSRSDLAGHADDHVRP